MQVGVKSSQALFAKIKPEHWDYRPLDNMRSLQELAHHLAMIPESDLAIMQEKDQETVQQKSKDATLMQRQWPRQWNRASGG